ncbi:MAG: Yip1 family protein [Methanocellales archaeon]|nr:Yip1 family protein [Methanocellales archaeon]
MNEQVYVLKDVIRNPARAFKEISDRGRAFLPGAIIIVTVPAIASALLMADVSFPQNLAGLVRDVTGWIIFVGCLYVVGRLLRGGADFMGLLSAIGYAKLPGIFYPIVGAALVRLVPEEVVAQLGEGCAGGVCPEPISPEQQMLLLKQIFTPAVIGLFLAILALGIWIFALYVLASRESHKSNTWRAFISVVVGGLTSTIITGLLLTLVGL